MIANTGERFGMMTKESTFYHEKRPIRFLGLWEHSGWRVKVYGVRQSGEKPDSHLVRIAKEIAAKNLPQPAISENRYGVAFLTIHHAAMFNQIVLDWWEHANELRHHVFKASATAPYSFRNITATGEAFCVWELRVICFERESWLDAVLTNSDAGGLERYLALQLNEDA